MENFLLQQRNHFQLWCIYYFTARSPFFQQSEKAHCNQMQPMNLYGIETNLRRLRTLLRPADKPIFIGLSFAGEAVDLRVRSQGAFVVNVTAANSSDTPCVH